jgi:hypothetical protein
MLVVPHSRALAYLDPTSGSFILQIIFAGALGALVSIRIFWKQITGFFKRTNNDEEAGDVASTERDDE